MIADPIPRFPVLAQMDFQIVEGHRLDVGDVPAQIHRDAIGLLVA